MSDPSRRCSWLRAWGRGVKEVIGTHRAPVDEVRPLDAVRGGARRLGERAQRERGLRGEEPERAVEAGREPGQDDARVALEALRAPVHHRLHRLLHRVTLVVVLCRANPTNDNHNQTWNEQLALPDACAACGVLCARYRRAHRGEGGRQMDARHQYEFTTVVLEIPRAAAGADT